MGLHYLTFIGKNFKNNKKLVLLQLVNNVNVNIMNSVGVSSDSAAMNNYQWMMLGWIVFPINSVGMHSDYLK